METSEKQLHLSILDAIPLGILVLNDDFTIIFWNNRLEDWSGIARDQAIGTDITEIFPGASEAKFKSRIENIFHGAPPTIFSSLLHKYVFPMSKRDGSYRIQHTSVTPLAGPTGSICALVAIQDESDLSYRIQAFKEMRDKALTEIEGRKKVEVQLRKAKQVAEDATALKDKFVSLVSHDLRGPLGNVRGCLQIIRDALHDTIDADLKEMMELTVESTAKMDNLIKDLLHIGRLRSGKIEPKYRFLNMHDIASRVFSLLSGSAQKKEITFVNNIPENSRIYADATLLHEVVQNLVSNAVKFCNKGHNVSVSVLDDEPATVVVTDTGIGMERDKLIGLFRYDVKSSTAGTAGETGTGLGLPLVHDIVEAHGGVIDVESAVGAGTTFYVRLPRVTPTILLAQHDEAFRNQCALFLKKLGIDIVEAANGKEAMEKIEQSLPHLVVTGIMMEGIDGFGLLEYLKSSTRTESLPVIVITADTRIETREKVFRLGADDFVTKPIVPHDLIPRIHRFVG